MDLLLADFQQSGQWELVLPSKMEIITINSYSKVRINLQLKRNPTFYILVILVPNFCLILLSFALFFLPFSGGEKVSTGLTVFLAIVVELIVVSDVLPPTGADDLPVVAQVLVILVTLVFLSVFVAIVLSAIYSKETALPRIWQCFLDSKTVHFFCWRRKQDGEVDLIENRNVTKSPVSETGMDKVTDILPSFAPERNTPIHSWKTLAEVLNQICFLFYCLSIVLTVMFLAFEMR